MTTEEFQKLLDKHLKGESTAAEKKQIEQFEQHFLETNRHTVFASDEEKAAVYRELYARVAPPATKRFGWLKVAAAVLLFIGLSYSGWYISHHTETIKTAYGERISLTLSDGSHVQLNGGSALTYTSWWGKERKIELEGEAYFEVAKDTAQPFAVYANGIKTTALGTEFNVNAYPEDSVVLVSLLEGFVQVNGFKQVDTLMPNEQAAFTRKNKQLYVQAFQAAETLAWRANQLVLKKTSFGQLALILKRNYGVELTFEDPSVKDYTVNGRLENSDITAFLEAVSAAKGLEVKKQAESAYVIYKAGKDE